MSNGVGTIILEYIDGIWNWFSAVIDDDIHTVNYTFYNSTGGVVQSNQSNVPMDINTGNLTFIDLGIFNWTIWTNDTFGNVTRETMLFNVTEARVGRLGAIIQAGAEWLRLRCS